MPQKGWIYNQLSHFRIIYQMRPIYEHMEWKIFLDMCSSSDIYLNSKYVFESWCYKCPRSHVPVFLLTPDKFLWQGKIRDNLILDWLYNHRFHSWFRAGRHLLWSSRWNVQKFFRRVSEMGNHLPKIKPKKFKEAAFVA